MARKLKQLTLLMSKPNRIPLIIKGKMVSFIHKGISFLNKTCNRKISLLFPKILLDNFINQCHPNKLDLKIKDRKKINKNTSLKIFTTKTQLLEIDFTYI